MTTDILTFLKERDAKPGDFLIGDKGVAMVASIQQNECFLIVKESEGDLWIQTDEIALELNSISKPLALTRNISPVTGEDRSMFRIDAWNIDSKTNFKFRPIYGAKPKRTVTIEVPEGAEIKINGEKYDY